MTKKLEIIPDYNDKEKFKKVIRDIRELEFKLNQYINNSCIEKKENTGSNLNKKYKIKNYYYYIEDNRIQCKAILDMLTNPFNLSNILYYRR